MLKVRLYHKRKRQPVFALPHLLKVEVTKAQLIRFYPHVRLHHRRTHYVLHRPAFKHIPESAYGAAALWLEDLGNGYCKYTFSHKTCPFLLKNRLDYNIMYFKGLFKYFM